MSSVRRLSVLILSLILAGCSADAPQMTNGVKVSGKILLPSGGPLTGGTLILRPENGLFGATGQIQPDGKFSLENAGKQEIAPGRYQVFVRFNDPNQARLKTTIHERYQQNGDDSDSDVTVDIQTATEDMVIQLKR